MDGVVYEFSGFRLDPKHRRVTNEQGETIALSPRAFDALLMLVERPGELFDKRSLIKAVWRHVVVEDNSLDQTISLLRRALQHKAPAAPLIVTERGRGYRFVAGVNRVAAAALEGRDTFDGKAQQLLAQAHTLVVRPSPSNLHGALELLNAAIERCPQFAAAIAERALLRTVFLSFDLPMDNGLAAAEQEARQALALDPMMARAHQALANVCTARAEWLAARTHFDAACRLESSPNARVTRVWQLSHSVGHLQLAREQAIEIDALVPFLPLGAVALTLAFDFLGMGEDAFRSAERATALGWPRTQAPLPDYYFMLAVRTGRFADAAAWLTEGLSPAMRGSGGGEVVAQLCLALQMPIHRPAAVESLRQLIGQVGVGALGQQNQKRALLWFVLLGSLDAAFEYLHHTLDHLAHAGTTGSPWGSLWLPEMLPFRSDARFHEVVGRFRFMDYWIQHGPPDAHVVRNARLVSLRS